MPTIRDVAKLAGVSVATVSHVVNGTHFVSEPARERVINAMRALDYQRNEVARSLRRGRTLTLGLVLPDSANPFFAEIGRSIESAAASQGYSVILCNTYGDINKERSYVDLLLAKQVDGIIVDTEEKHGQGLAARFPYQLPVVLVDREIPENPFDTVVTDNQRGARLATEHLISLGHRRIGCITGPHHLTSSVQRLSGFRQALAEAGLSDTEDLIFHGDFRPPSGLAGFQNLINLPEPPTAIFACNDMMALGVLRAALEAGVRVPQDLAVAGFDDIEIGQFVYPSLTTIAQQKDEIGLRTIQRIVELISGDEKGPQTILVPPRLITRESSGAQLRESGRQKGSSNFP
jgi:LacI family transcriptional regulator